MAPQAAALEPDPTYVEHCSDKNTNVQLMFHVEIISRSSYSTYTLNNICSICSSTYAACSVTAVSAAWSETELLSLRYCQSVFPYSALAFRFPVHILHVHFEVVVPGELLMAQLALGHGPVGVVCQLMSAQHLLQAE